MKKTRCAFIYVLVCLPLLLNGQSVARYVLSNFGHYSKSETLQVNLTLGEAATSRHFFEDASGSISVGFQRPYVLHPTLPQSASELLQLQVSPNPANERIFFTIDSSVKEGLQLRLTDISGRILINQYGVRPGKGTIEMEAYPTGIYLLSVVYDNRLIITQRVVKMK